LAKPVYSTGDVPTATDFNEWLVNVRWARKSANLDRSSTTTFTDDPDLTLTVLANAVYEVRSSLLIHSSSQVAGDFKFKFTGPAGAVLLSTVTGYDVAATTNNNVVTTGMTLNTSASLGIVSLVEPWNPVQTMGVLVTSGTAGSFTLQWAQNVSSGTVTRLQAQSFLMLNRVE
jgi:hypothetical protein